MYFISILSQSIFPGPLNFVVQRKTDQSSLLLYTRNIDKTRENNIPKIRFDSWQHSKHIENRKRKLINKFQRENNEVSLNKNLLCFEYKNRLCVC